MTEERLKEIKDSFGINYITFGRSAGKTLMSKHFQQELELYNEVIRLREENKMLDELINANYLSWQDSLSRIEKAVEYIENTPLYTEYIESRANKAGVKLMPREEELLNILNGRSDE